jgi:hypothetical protein
LQNSKTLLSCSKLRRVGMSCMPSEA